MVLMIPLINTLKSHYPNAKIYTLQQRYTAPLLTAHPAITEVLIDRKKSGEAKGLLGFWAYAKWLRAQKFDAVIMPYLEPYYARLMWVAGIPIRIGDGQKLFLRPWLTHPIALDYRNVMRHECVQMAKLAEGLDPDIPFVSTMDLALTDEDRAQASTLMETMGISLPFIIIHPASGGGNRPWSAAKYAEFIGIILAETDLQIVLTGAGKGERNKVTEIMNWVSSVHTEAYTRMISTVDQTSLRTLMALIEQATVVVGTDTGPTHIAAALKRPVLCISPTKFVKSLRWGPWETPRRIVSASEACDLVCRPYRCPVSTCLDAIDTRKAFEALLSLMIAPPQGGALDFRGFRVPAARSPSSSQLEGVGQTQNTEPQHSLMQTSLHIGILIRDNDDMPHYQPFYEVLKKEGFQVWILSAKLSPWALLKSIWAHDLCVIHSREKPFAWGLLRQIAALRMYVPPVWTADTADSMDEIEALYQRVFA